MALRGTAALLLQVMMSLYLVSADLVRFCFAHRYFVDGHRGYTRDLVGIARQIYNGSRPVPVIMHILQGNCEQLSNHASNLEE